MNGKPKAIDDALIAELAERARCIAILRVHAETAQVNTAALLLRIAKEIENT